MISWNGTMGDLSLAKYVAFSHELSKSYCEIPATAQVCWKHKYHFRKLSWFCNEIVLVPAFLDKISRFSTCNRPGMRIHLQKTFDPLWCPPLMPHQNGLKSLPKELSNFQATAFSRNIPFLFIILQYLWKFYKYILWKKTNTGGWIIDAVTSSGILKAKQKLGVTFNSDKLGGINFTKFSNWPFAVPKRKPRHWLF